MHIHFNRLIVHNFMSFGTADIRFNDDGFIRVSGINENPLDNAKSNGSGKSSLWEAIVWAITGETIRGTKHIVNFYGDDGCYVEVEFYIDTTRYQIIRSKDHAVRKTSIQILVNGEDLSGKGLRDSEKLLQQYLPDLTASLLGSVIILGQGLPQRFTNNTPSGRKEVLEQLSKSDFMIEDLKARVGSRKQELTAEIRRYEDSLVQCRGTEKLLRTQIDENTAILATLNKEELEAQLVTAKTDVCRCEDDVAEVVQAIDELTAKHAAYSVQLTQLSADELSAIQSAQELHQSSTADLQQQVHSLTAEETSLRKSINQIQSIKDVCPTCGQKLLGVTKPDTSDLEEALTKCTAILQASRKSLHEQEETYKDACNNIKQQYATEKQQLNAAIQTTATQLVVQRDNKQQLELQLKQTTQAMSAVELRLAQLQATIDNCKEIIRNNNESLSVIADEIMYNNKQKDLTQEHLDVIKKFDTALTRDFRGYLLSTVISYIETRAKEYAKLIFDTTSVTFTLDGNNIDISYMNKPYENLSGGEKQKIDLIIQFSIRDMLAAQLNFTSNILVLDEVFDGLDAVGCDRIINMIATLTDVHNVFIVTHRKDLSLPTDKELIVVKSSAGISGIRQ